MENLNKDYIIYALIGVITFLVTYLAFEKPMFKEVVKTEYETVVEEKVIYRDVECPQVFEIVQNGIDTLEIVKEETPQEHLITSTFDVHHRYTISLFTYETIPQVHSFKKMVLNAKIHDEDMQSIFVMDVNQEILNSLGDVYFKVMDNHTKKSYTNHDSCLYNTVEGFIYHTNLYLSGEEIMCDISEDRELTQSSKKLLLGNKANKEISKTFLKMDSSTLKGL